MSKNQIKKRGVKVGTKRGSYKKKNLNALEQFEVKTDIKNKENEFNNSVINEVETETQTETQPEIKTETEVNNRGEDNYNKFFSEYGQPLENEDDLIDTEVKTENKEHENKTFDFTNSNTANSQTNFSETKKSSAMLVNGYMLLALCDIIVPNAILWLYGKVDERAKRVKASDTKLTEEQREALLASAHEVAQYIFQHVNPAVIFFVGMGVMYGGNIQTEISKYPKIKKPIKTNKNANGKNKAGASDSE
jgi:hypothetical protein